MSSQEAPNQPTPVETLAYRVEDAARATGIPAEELEADIKDGTLPHIDYYMGRTLILKRDLEAYLYKFRHAIHEGKP